MGSLYLSDILRRNNLEPAKIKLLRHSKNHSRFKKCYDAGCMDIYQRIQNKGFFDKFDYVLSFVSEPGTSAKFVGCYSIGLGEPINNSMMPKDFPVPEMFIEDSYYYDLQPTELLGDLRERLIIDWGKSAVSWHQKATNEKAVLAIQANPKTAFTGYENVVLSFNELKDIIMDKTLYENWHTALSSIYAIYLITDVSTGRHYIGSAYGKGGLLGRWEQYVKTWHGNNNGMKEVLNIDPEGYKNFQFSIMQILPKTVTEDEVIQIENLYKKKLGSKLLGLNKN